jgi:hypothetical protein
MSEPTNSGLFGSDRFAGSMARHGSSALRPPKVRAAALRCCSPGRVHRVASEAESATHRAPRISPAPLPAAPGRLACAPAWRCRDRCDLRRTFRRLRGSRCCEWTPRAECSQCEKRARAAVALRGHPCHGALKSRARRRSCCAGRCPHPVPSLFLRSNHSRHSSSRVDWGSCPRRSVESRSPGTGCRPSGR